LHVVAPCRPVSVDRSSETGRWRRGKIGERNVAGAKRKKKKEKKQQEEEEEEKQCAGPARLEWAQRAPLYKTARRLPTISFIIGGRDPISRERSWARGLQAAVAPCNAAEMVGLALICFPVMPLPVPYT
jgi:hypothetical protein